MVCLGKEELAMKRLLLVATATLILCFTACDSYELGNMANTSLDINNIGGADNIQSDNNTHKNSDTQNNSDTQSNSNAQNNPSETLMYADSEFNLCDFEIDIPDFSPFTSTEYSDLNANGKYDRIVEIESGVVYCYNNYDADSNGINRYITLLESLGFVNANIDREDITYAFTKNDVALIIGMFTNGSAMSTVAISISTLNNPNEYSEEEDDLPVGVDRLYTVGDTVDTGGLQLTLINVDINLDDLERDSIIFSFEIYNNSDSDKRVSISDFELSNAEGYMMDRAFFIEDYLNDTIKPGKKASGNVAFKYVQSSYYDLYFETGWTTNDIVFRFYSN
jgi:hypothetical protein